MGAGRPGCAAGSNASSFLSRSRHPDKNKDPGAEDKFIQISKAYEVRERRCRKEKGTGPRGGWSAALGWVRLGDGRLKADLIAPYGS